MKALKKLTFGIAVACGCSAAQAVSTVYDYSYQFQNGQTISGSFTGQEAGGLITNIGNVTGQTSPGGDYGMYVFHDLLPGSYDNSFGIQHTGAVVSFDGLHSNFFFTNATDTNWFYVFPNGGGSPLEQAKLEGERFIDFDNRNYVASRFNVVAEAVGDPGEVPEPASFALIGLGLAGIAAMRRRPAK
ncbi:MAG: PEP-CTERM sorting domain-containing protein [Pseudomonadota bacterium]|nr:PEP-CTERM sorting domain-containing protein [Pseudomonadota bacterium]